MKLKTVLPQVICGIAVAVTASAQQTLTWDPGKTGGSGGAGTWDLTASANWYNGTSDVTWQDNSALGINTAVFGGTAGIVTLNSSVSASNLLFNTTGYTISGSGALTLGAGGINAASLTSGATTVGVGLVLPVVQEAWQVGSGGTLNINGAVTRDVGATVDFSPLGINTASPSLANDADGIVGGWATSGNSSPSTTTGDFVTITNNIITICTNYVLLSVSASTSPNLTGVSGQNWVSGALNGANNITTVTNSVTIHSLIQQGDFVVSEGDTLTLGSGGLIMRGISRWLIDQSPNNIGTAAIDSGLASGELFVHVPNGDTQNNGTDGGNWRIWPIIKDNGATSAKLIKDGPGCVILQNFNTYSGGTFIDNGIVIAGGGNTSQALEPVTLGTGSVTINKGGVLEFGYGTQNANLDYDITNNIIMLGGAAVCDDGHQHLTGAINVQSGGILGSTYDGGADPTFGNKGLYVDGVVSGSGPLFLEQAVTAGDNDMYGNGGGNPYNSSIVEFTNSANTYSGTITIVPYTTGTGAGSYLAINTANTLQFATLDLINNTGVNQRFGGTPLIFRTGMGSATVGAITGSGNIILNGFNENTYARQADAIALTVGNNTSTTYSGNISGSGSLVKAGAGILTDSGVNTYAGNTLVTGGKLVLTGSFLDSTNVVISAGATLDSSALGTVILASGQNLLSSGTMNGSVTASSGAEVFGDSGSGYGTSVLNNNLTLNSGALVHFSVSTSASGPNDLITIGGTLSANNNIVHVSAPSTSVSLQIADYTLLTSANPISGTFISAPSWDVAPANAGNYSIVVSGNTLKLHYSAATSPTAGGSATPNPALRNQNVLITVTTTNGTGGTVNSVVVNASPIGGSSSLALVNQGGNVWSATVAVAPTTLVGGVTLVATITDTASLNGIVNIPLTVADGNDVWNGGGGNANWSTALNWTNKLAPGYIGDSIEFAGINQLSPNIDNNYTITALLFDLGAGAFNIGGNTLTLTGTGLITVNSASPETLNAVLADLGGGVTKSGNGVLNLTANETYTGPTTVNGGMLNISGNIASTTNVFVGNQAGNSVLNLSGAANVSPFYMLIGDASGSVAAVYQAGGSVGAGANSGFDNLAVGNVGGSYGYYDVVGGSLSAAGVCIAGEDNTGTGANFAGSGGNGILDIQNGATVDDTGWFVMARNTGDAQTAIVDVYSGGTLTVSPPAGGWFECNWGSGQTSVINVWGTIEPPLGSILDVGLGGGTSGILNLETGGLFQASLISGAFGGTGGIINFNGGTIQSLPQLVTPVAALINASSAYSYSGGAIIDDDGSTVTNTQPLLAPGGNGIYSASVTSAGSGYIAPPIVTIVPGIGDATGAGAMAIAQINPVTGTVTGIVITSPGQNYTATPTFTLTGGGGSGAVITSGAPQANASGGLTIESYAGGGEVVLTGINTYVGSTVVSNDEGSATTLALAGSGSIADSTNIMTQSGCTFDVTAVSSFALAGGQTLSGLGNVVGSVTAAAGSFVSAGIPGTPGVNTLNNNLALASGAGCSLALSTTYNANDDQIVVSGTLTANNNVIHLSAPSISSSLDTTADYVLITAGSISGTFASSPVWDVAPVNAAHYSIVTSGTTVTLHYSATVVSPTVTASASPTTVLRNQPTLITANVTPGSASISTVKADFTSVGGSIVSLVQSNSSNIYTNSVMIPPTASPGNDSVTVTVTDSASQSGSTSVSLTVISGNDVWNGLGGNANWSTALNWANDLAPGYVGDSVEFGGNTQTSPNMNTNYTVTSVKFDTGAGGFNISSANSSTLTLSGSGSLTNGSANNQTLNVTVGDANGGLTKSGGPITLAGNNTYTGPTVVNSGVLNVPGQVVAASNSVTTVGASAGNSVLNVSATGDFWAYSMLVGNASNAVGAVYQNGGTVWANTNSGVDNLCLGNVPGAYGYYDANGGTLSANGICIGGEDNSGHVSNFGLAGSGIMDINGSTVNDSGWFIIARNNNLTNGAEVGVLNVYSGYLTYAGGGLVGPWDTGESAIINVMGGVVSNTAAVGVYLGNVGYDGILNLNGGTLQASIVQGYNGPTYAPVNYGQLNFNGGTLQASAASSSFILVNGAIVYNGGATINNNGFGVIVGQPLQAPSGKGVHGIASFTGGSGYIAPPIVTITNGVGDTTGTGATAIAQINSANGTVTNVLITCPGVNYTATPIFVVSGGGATVAATVTGAAPTTNVGGGLTAAGSGTLTLTGTNTYTGNTVISAGTLALTGSGSIATSPNINVAAANATFSVPGTFNLGASQTLMGIGTVTGNVTNNGTIMAGTASSLGTFSFNNNLTLQAGGTTVVKLNQSLSANDQIYCYGNLTYGGTLLVENLGGTLQAGDTFQVFFTGGSFGNFAGISGSPGAGLAYSFNPSSGVITVVTASASITGLKFTASPVVSGTSVTFSATNSGAGTVYMLTTTNIAPSVTWTPIWTNVLGGSSVFTTNLSNAVKAGTKQQFYILSNTNK
jgi:autotransporter-associated beta strand protein